MNGLSDSQLTSLINKIELLKSNYSYWSNNYLKLEAIKNIAEEVLEENNFIDIESLLDF